MKHIRTGYSSMREGENVTKNKAIGSISVSDRGTIGRGRAVRKEKRSAPPL